MSILNCLNLKKKYVLGCSGGPDSMALFAMLLKSKINFVIAFINYHKRVVSDNEEKMVLNFSLEHNIPFYHMDAVKKTGNGNFQAWARTARYDFFVYLCKKYQLDGIIIAHHKDDLIETYLMQQKRKGIYDYYGLQAQTYYQNIPLIRPLLNYRKKDLLAYCQKNNIPYSIDESNLHDDYSRNKIRHEIVEKLSDIQIEKLCKQIDDLNKENKKKNIKVNKYISSQDNFFQIDKFMKIDSELQKRIIYSLLKKEAIFTSGKEIENIIKFIIAKNTEGIYEFSSSDLKIFKNYNYFELSYIKKTPYKFVLYKEDVVSNEYVYFDLKNNAKTFFIKEDSYPLTITNVDKIEYVIIGKIKKKVNRILIDEKIPLKFRLNWPCIKDKTGKIIFIPRKSKIYSPTILDKVIFIMKEK